jgi:DNA repair exonuclease SbcCD ATPase subunit
MDRLAELREEESRLENLYKNLSSDYIMDSRHELLLEKTYGIEYVWEEYNKKERERAKEKKNTWQDLEKIRREIKALGGKTASEIEQERREKQARIDEEKRERDEILERVMKNLEAAGTAIREDQKKKRRLIGLLVAGITVTTLTLFIICRLKGGFF